MKQLILAGLAGLMIAACGTSAGSGDQRNPVMVTATYEAAKDEIIARSRSKTTPTRATGIVGIVPSAPSPTATTGTAEPVAIPPFDLDAVPEAAAPEKIKSLTMPGSQEAIFELIDRLPLEIGPRLRVDSVLYNGELGSWGAGYAHQGSEPPSYIDLLFVHIPTYATAPAIPAQYRIPAEWDAAQDMAYLLSGTSPDLPTERILGGGRDGDLFWVQLINAHGGVQIQWGYRGSPWEYVVNGGSEEDLNAILDTIVSVINDPGSSV